MTSVTTDSEDVIANGGTVFVFGEPLLELSSVTGDSARLGIGGDTFNTSVYLARAGIDVQYVTAIGDDPMSGRVLDALRAENIGTDYVSVVPGRPVGLYAIEVDDEGERSFTYWRSQSAFRSWFKTPGTSAALKAMASARALYLSGITLSVFTHEERAEIVGLMERAQKNGVTTVFDTNYRPLGWPIADAARVAVEQIRPFVTISMPTFEDEADLFGTSTPEDSAAYWRDAGCREVCVKSGPRGAFLSVGEWVRPEQERQPKDTTGAGDSFNGGYLAARLKGARPQDAAKAGNDLAGRVIMTSGAILPR